MTPSTETAEFDDTEALRQRLTDLVQNNVASKHAIRKKFERARRRVLAHQNDLRWLQVEQEVVAARAAQIQRLLPELRRRDQLSADAAGLGRDDDAGPGVAVDFDMVIGEAPEALGRSPALGSGAKPWVKSRVRSPRLDERQRDEERKEVRP